MFPSFSHDFPIQNVNVNGSWGIFPAGRALAATPLARATLADLPVGLYIPSGYDQQFAMEDPPMLLRIGKPSISIRAMASMAMLNNQRVNPFKGNRNSRSKVEIY